MPVAERIAIDGYPEMIRYGGEGDSTTRRLLEQVLATEEEHAEDLVTLIQDIGKRPMRCTPPARA